MLFYYRLCVCVCLCVEVLLLCSCLCLHGWGGGGRVPLRFLGLLVRAGLRSSGSIWPTTPSVTHIHTHTPDKRSQSRLPGSAWILLTLCLSCFHTLKLQEVLASATGSC